ncbi:hypothetical protein EIN_408690, partial [Entamoeba invadens IP1]
CRCAMVFKKSLMCGHYFLTPLVVKFSPPFTFVNMTPLTLELTCVRSTEAVELTKISRKNKLFHGHSLAGLSPKRKIRGLIDEHQKRQASPQVLSPNPSSSPKSPSYSNSVNTQNTHAIGQQPTSPILTSGSVSYLQRSVSDMTDERRETVTIAPFGSASLTVAASTEIISYSVRVTDVTKGFGYDPAATTSAPINYSHSRIDIPDLVIGKRYYLRQKKEGRTITFGCPYYFKNMSRGFVKIKGFVTIPPDGLNYLYAPCQVRKDVGSALPDTLIFEGNNGTSDTIEIQVGETKTIHVNDKNLFMRIVPQKWEGKQTDALKIVVMPHYIFSNQTKLSLTLEPCGLKVEAKSDIAVHTPQIKFKTEEGGRSYKLDLTQTDEYQVMVKTGSYYSIFNLRTENLKGTFVTTLTGTNTPYIRIDNRSDKSFLVKQSCENGKYTMTVHANRSIPFAWVDPIGERKIFVNDVAVDPLKIEEVYEISNQRVSIDIDGSTTVLVIGAEKRKTEEIIWTLSVCIPVLGVSLFGRNAQELLSLTVNTIKVELIQMNRHIGLEAQFDYIQLDYQGVNLRVLPVIISPRPMEWIYDRNNAFFHIGLLLATPNQNNLKKMWYISRATITMQPLEVSLKLDILQSLFQAYYEYPALFMSLDDSDSTPSEIRLIIDRVIINSIDVNISIEKGAQKPPKHMTVLRTLYDVVDMDVDRIPVKLWQQKYLNKSFSQTTFWRQIKEKWMDDLGQLKWVVIGKLFGLRAVGNAQDNRRETTEKFQLCDVNELNDENKASIDMFFGREESVCLKKSRRDKEPSHAQKDVPTGIVEAQQSTFDYSVLDATKNLGTSVVRGVKGVWKTSIGMTNIAGTQKRSLAPAGFMGGVLVGAAGFVLKPLDGVIGIFKGLNDGMTGVTFGQIAKERMRPVRYCKYGLTKFDYFISQGWSLFMEGCPQYQSDGFTSWQKQTKEDMIIAMIFTCVSLICVKKKIGELAEFVWRVPYVKIDSFGFDGNNIVLQLKVEMKSGLFKKRNTFKIEDWPVDRIPEMKEMIDKIRGQYVAMR